MGRVQAATRQRHGLAGQRMRSSVIPLDPGFDAGDRSGTLACKMAPVKDSQGRTYGGQTGDAPAASRPAGIRRAIATVSPQARNRHALSADPIGELTAAVRVGGTSQAVLDWLEGQVKCSRDDLTAELVVLWQAIGEIAAARAR